MSNHTFSELNPNNPNAEQNLNKGGSSNDSSSSSTGSSYQAVPIYNSDVKDSSGKVIGQAKFDPNTGQPLKQPSLPRVPLNNSSKNTEYVSPDSVSTADQPFAQVESSAYEKLIKESSGYLDSINSKYDDEKKAQEKANAENLAEVRGTSAAGGMGGSGEEATARGNAVAYNDQQIKTILDNRTTEMGNALQTIRTNAETMAQNEYTNDTALKTQAKADANDFIKNMASTHQDWSKFKTDNPQDYQHISQLLGGSNYADAAFANAIPKPNILNTTISGSTAMVISQDPVTGKTSANSYDLGINVPKTWTQEKIGTNAVLYHDANWDPNDPSTYQIFSIDPLTGLPTNQVAGDSNPTAPVSPDTITPAVSKVTSVAGISDPTVSLKDAIADPSVGISGLVNGIIANEGSSPAGVENNPGNIKFNGQAGATNSGVKATDGGTFASFKTESDGQKAIADVINNAVGGSSVYGANPSVASFVNKYTGQTIGSQSSSDYTDFTKGLTPQGQQAFNSLPETQKSNVSQLVSGKVLLGDLISSRGIQGTAQREKLISDAQKVDPTFSVNQNKIRYQFLQDWNDPNSKIGTTRNSINTALGHLADVKAMTTALTPEDNQVINKTKNWWNVQTGNPAITNLQFGLNALATEIATVYKGAAPSEGEIDAEKAVLGTQLSSSQFEGLLNTVSQFLSSKITASRYQYKQTMGQEYEQPIIDPDKKQALVDAGIDSSKIATENTNKPQSVQDVATSKGFDYQSAKNAGYTDEQIQAYLNQ